MQEKCYYCGKVQPVERKEHQALRRVRGETRIIQVAVIYCKVCRSIIRSETVSIR